MKNGSWPSGVTVALLSHSTWMRPAKVSATTGPADIRSITGCSPVGSPGKSPRFLTIPHDNSDLPNPRTSPTQGFRIMHPHRCSDSRYRSCKPVPYGDFLQQNHGLALAPQRPGPRCDPKSARPANPTIARPRKDVAEATFRPARTI